MNTLPFRDFLGSGCLQSLRLYAGLLASIGLLYGCGGSADQVIATTTANTPLAISNFSGLTAYTVGTSQVYSLTVKDPDGIASVSVSLDGANVPVTNVGDVYSVTVPASFAVGTHSLIFSARGKSSDGTLEVPISEGINFTVFVSNTPLTVSAVQGFAAYTLGTAQTYFADVVDPDGIRSVTATLNGQTLAVTQAANNPARYSVIVPASTPAGNNNIIKFEGIGKQPNATDEAAKASQLAFIIYPNNTPLITGNIAGLSSYTIGGTQSYSLAPVDPDGITAVTATLDGGPVALTAAGNTYSFNTPTNLTVGNHAVSFTATGKQPNGNSETAVVVSQNFTVLTTNTPLNVSAISGATTYTVGNTSQYTTTVTDPDGIVSVTATLDGTSIAVAPSGSNYSITLPTSVTTGAHTIQFSGVGRRPDGTSETAQTVTQQIQVLPLNTNLSIGPVSGLAAYTTGATPTYTTNIVDPDGVGPVSATLDNVTIGVSSSNGIYSVTVPNNLSLGRHTLVFTARGTLPYGGQEAAQTSSITFNVLPQNTALTISAVTGPATLALNTIGTYSATVTDPDGISSVSARIDNVPTNVTRNGSVYSVQTPAYNTGGAHVVEFTAVGLLPLGNVENAQVESLGFNAQTPNTAISISAISGPTAISVGQAPIYSVDVVDPDGITSVTATLAGQSIAVTPPTTGSTYSIRLPALTLGSYDIVFTAVGVIAGGTTETAQTQPLKVSVSQANNPVVFGSIFTQDVNLGAGFIRQYSVDITDPEGIDNVTAEDSNGLQLTVTISANPTTGRNTIYSAQAYSGALQNGSTVTVRFVKFTATGLQPNGSTQAPQSIQ